MPNPKSSSQLICAVTLINITSHMIGKQAITETERQGKLSNEEGNTKNKSSTFLKTKTNAQ